MVKKIIISYSPEEARMAVLENGELVEVAFERNETGNIVGNIYKGKVRNILPGMQAAFVDIGREKNAFLFTGDAKKGIEHLTVGQDVLIQIVKDAMGSKGPRATTNITLPGRYAVLMPMVDYTGVSRRITDDAERNRLKDAALECKPQEIGVIIRTVAQGKPDAEIHRDVKYLYHLWQTIKARTQYSDAPALIHRDVDLVIRIVRDYLTDEVEEFILDNKDAYTRVCELLKYMPSDIVNRVKLYSGSEDIFTHYGLDEQFNKLLSRKVELKCGGYLIIDHTEALTVIDVNTGSYVGGANLADTVFTTNLEAAEEIAKQIRLRDIGGIIIVDFIDMNNDEHKMAVLAQLAEKVKADKKRTNVLGLTALGLVEMTRKKVRQSINSLMFVDCPYCDGKGRMLSPETIVINIRRKLRRIAAKNQPLIIQVHPKVQQYMNKRNEKEKLETEFSRTITIEGVAGMHPSVFTIYTV